MGILLTLAARSSTKRYTSHPEWLRDWPLEATATPPTAGCQLLPHDLGPLRRDAGAGGERWEGGCTHQPLLTFPVGRGFDLFGHAGWARKDHAVAMTGYLLRRLWQSLLVL